MRGRWKGGIRYEWNALRPHFSLDHLLYLYPGPSCPSARLFSLFLASSTSFTVSSSPLLSSPLLSSPLTPSCHFLFLSFSLFLPLLHADSHSTSRLPSVYLHTAGSLAWFHTASSIFELKFKGARGTEFLHARLKASYFTSAVPVPASFVSREASQTSCKICWTLSSISLPPPLLFPFPYLPSRFS